MNRIQHIIYITCHNKNDTYTEFVVVKILRNFEIYKDFMPLFAIVGAEKARFFEKRL